MPSLQSESTARLGYGAEPRWTALFVDLFLQGVLCVLILAVACARTVAVPPVAPPSMLRGEAARESTCGALEATLTQAGDSAAARSPSCSSI